MIRAGYVVLLFCSIPMLGLAWRSAGPSSLGQQRKEADGMLPDVRVLQATEKIDFASPGPVVIAPNVRCDLNGNIYAHYSESIQALIATAPYSDGMQRLPFYKLTPRSKGRVAFAPPVIPDYPYLLRTDFSVDPHGTAYALFDAYDGSDVRGRKLLGHLIVRYKDDGTMDSFEKLADFSRQHIVPAHFAIFGDGNFMVTGTLWGPDSVGPFTALFNRAGNFVSTIRISHDVETTSTAQPVSHAPAKGRQEATNSTPRVSQRKPNGPPPTGKSRPDVVGAVSGSLAVSAPDGNVYMLRATDSLRLYAISPGGQQARELVISRPNPGLIPLQMGLAGADRLFIQFRQAGPQGPGGTESSLIEVLEPSSGEVSAVYRLDPGDRDFSEPGCASSAYDFLFVGASKDNRLEVLRFSAR